MTTVSAPVFPKRERAGDQRPVLVVFDQMVIGVAREGQRVEPERIDDRQLQQSQAGAQGGQLRQVEMQDVVAEYEGGAIGEFIELVKRGTDIATAPMQMPVVIGTDRTNLLQPATFLVYLEIDRYATPLECF